MLLSFSNMCKVVENSLKVSLVPFMRAMNNSGPKRAGEIDEN